MVRILALLAVLALVVAPLNAAAAQRACSHMDMSAAATADQPAHVHSDTDGTAPMPCCEPGPSKTMSDGCLAACVAMAGVSAHILSPTGLTPPAFAWMRFETTPATGLRAHPPPRLERPPKSIA